MRRLLFYRDWRWRFLRCLKGICYYVGRSAPFSYGFDSCHYTWQIVAHLTFEKYDTMLLRVVCRLLWIVLLTSWKTSSNLFHWINSIISVQQLFFIFVSNQCYISYYKLVSKPMFFSSKVCLGGRITKMHNKENVTKSLKDSDFLGLFLKWLSSENM